MPKKTKMCATVSDRMIGGVKKTFYNKVGVAYVNEDETIDVVLEAVPVNGRFTIRDWKPAAPAPEKDDRTTAEKDGDDIPF